MKCLLTLVRNMYKELYSESWQTIATVIAVDLEFKLAFRNSILEKSVTSLYSTTGSSG